MPPDINDSLSAANTALEAHHENLQTVIDGRTPRVVKKASKLSRLIKARLAIDARANLDPLVALDRPGKPVLIRRPTPRMRSRPGRHSLAAVTGQLQTQ